MRLAVYRNGPQGLYFIAQAGLSAHKAEVCRLSPYYVNQVRAISALIEKQHDYNNARARA
jgi:hypothetical protein